MIARLRDGGFSINFASWPDRNHETEGRSRIVLDQEIEPVLANPRGKTTSPPMMRTAAVNTSDNGSEGGRPAFARGLRLPAHRCRAETVRIPLRDAGPAVRAEFGRPDRLKRQRWQGNPQLASDVAEVRMSRGNASPSSASALAGAAACGKGSRAAPMAISGATTIVGSFLEFQVLLY